MVRLVTEEKIRQYWDQLGMWQWEYFVQNIDISKDFIRQMGTRFDQLKWEDTISYQENIEEKDFLQFRDRPGAQNEYMLVNHPELSKQFIERWFGHSKFNIELRMKKENV